MPKIRSLVRALVFLAGTCLLLLPFLNLWQRHPDEFRKVVADGGAFIQYLKKVLYTPFYWFTTGLGILLMRGARRISVEIDHAIEHLKGNNARSGPTPKR